ncbi:MAG: HAD-IA family hydrolase [Candidatus Shapirobacteria bacterium]|jgi:HAD superfamily hydrolase (TIGR01549 family)
MALSLKAVIFDFDGTIANTYPVLKEILDELMPQMGYKQFSETEWQKFRETGTKELLKSTKISLVKLMIMVKRMQSELNRRLSEVEPFEGIKEVTDQLKKRGIVVGIISSDTKKNILEFLNKEEMEVDCLMTGTNLFGKDKLINKYLKQRGLASNEVIYVGDEIRDVEACKRVGVKVAAVTWGFNSKEALKKSQPDYLVDRPKDLMTVVLQSN